MKIQSTFIPKGKWHLAVIDSERSGAWLLPIVCFAVVSKTAEVGDPEDDVVAMVVDPEFEGGELTLASSFGDRVLGISEPGEEKLIHWHEVATKKIEDARSADDAVMLGKRAASIVMNKEIDAQHLGLLRHYAKDSQCPAAARMATFHLVSLGLVEPHMPDSSRTRPAQWVLSELGRVVVTFAKDPTQGEEPGGQDGDDDESADA